MATSLPGGRAELIINCLIEGEYSIYASDNTRFESFQYAPVPTETTLIMFIQATGLFTQIDVMTRGGPLDSTQSVVFQAVQRGFEKQDIAGGSTISVILFFMVLIVSIVQRYLTREKN